MTPGKPSYSIDGNDSQVHSSIYIIKKEEEFQNYPFDKQTRFLGLDPVKLI